MKLVRLTSSDLGPIVRLDIDVEVFEEGRQTDHGANDGGIVAIGQRPEGHQVDDEEIVRVNSHVDSPSDPTLLVRR